MKSVCQNFFYNGTVNAVPTGAAHSRFRIPLRRTRSRFLHVPSFPPRVFLGQCPIETCLSMHSSCGMNSPLSLANHPQVAQLRGMRCIWMLGMMHELLRQVSFRTSPTSWCTQVRNRDRKLTGPTFSVPAVFTLTLGLGFS